LKHLLKRAKIKKIAEKIKLLEQIKKGIWLDIYRVHEKQPKPLTVETTHLFLSVSKFHMKRFLSAAITSTWYDFSINICNCQWFHSANVALLWCKLFFSAKTGLTILRLYPYTHTKAGKTDTRLLPASTFYLQILRQISLWISEVKA